jgi:tetratricopeptide (TPR) repeat protein
MPHLLALMHHKTLLSPLAQANLKSKIASIDIKGQVHHRRAQRCLEESLTTYRSFYPQAHPKVAQTLGQLGVLNKFDYQKQKLLFEESLKNYQSFYGRDDPLEGAWILVYSGNLYRRLGQYPKAKELLEKSLKIYEDHYGPSHIQTAWVLANLGRFYRHVGDQKKAKELLERSLAIHAHYPENNEIEKAWVMMNLAIMHHNTEEFGKAKRMMDQGIKIYEKYYNPEDYELCWAYVHKAFMDAEITGDRQKAYKKISDVTETFIKKWGAAPTAKAWALERMVRVSLDLGDYESAKVFVSEMFLIHRELSGNRSVPVGFCYHYLGQIYEQLKDPQQAEYCFKEAFFILFQHHHPRIYIILQSLVRLYKNQEGILSPKTFYCESLLKKALNDFFPQDCS